MPVPVQLTRIIISEINDNQVIYLKEIDGPRQFHFFIGIYEASSIDRKVRSIPSQRPSPHDLIVQTIEQLGGEPHDVIICDLKKGTYYAKLRVQRDGELIEIDARPSDAIAVAVTCHPPLPIYVAEEVFEASLRDQA
jgi:uncharacterized protein